MTMHKIGFRIFLGVVILVVVATAAFGLWISGSPTQERARRLDGMRISNLQSISSAVDQYYNINLVLPPDLDTLLKARTTYYIGTTADPETGAPYEYAARSVDTYDLCATFVTDSRGQDISKMEPYPQGGQFWEHAAERTCFTITTQKYPKPL